MEGCGHPGTLSFGALILALAASPAASAAEPGGVVHVAWVDAGCRVSDTTRDVERELSSVLGSLGLKLRFRTASAGDDLRRGEVAVILMPVEAPSSLRAGKVMGAVQARPIEAAGAWVYLPEVMRALGHVAVPASSLGDAARAELGVALGRVAAHEVLHLVAPGAPHAHDGLMAAQLGRKALVGVRPAVDGATKAVVTRRPTV